MNINHGSSPSESDGVDKMQTEDPWATFNSGLPKKGKDAGKGFGTAPPQKGGLTTATGRRRCKVRLYKTNSGRKQRVRVYSDHESECTDQPEDGDHQDDMDFDSSTPSGDSKDDSLADSGATAVSAGHPTVRAISDAVPVPYAADNPLNTASSARGTATYVPISDTSLSPTNSSGNGSSHLVLPGPATAGHGVADGTLLPPSQNGTGRTPVTLPDDVAVRLNDFEQRCADLATRMGNISGQMADVQAVVQTLPETIKQDVAKIEATLSGKIEEVRALTNLHQGKLCAHDKELLALQSQIQRLEARLYQAESTYVHPSALRDSWTRKEEPSVLHISLLPKKTASAADFKTFLTRLLAAADVPANKFALHCPQNIFVHQVSIHFSGSGELPLDNVRKFRAFLRRGDGKYKTPTELGSVCDAMGQPLQIFTNPDWNLRSKQIDQSGRSIRRMLKERSRASFY